MSFCFWTFGSKRRGISLLEATPELWVGGLLLPSILAGTQVGASITCLHYVVLMLVSGKRSEYKLESGYPPIDMNCTITTLIILLEHQSHACMNLDLRLHEFGVRRLICSGHSE
ncbi:hypothetical protein VNO77_02971 [Canavalia gladiata]|uniref:Uncharacterized protein n=1 Tax=Canavalia gladiata TaxID=3824 RepID=A0AAN9R3G7_CANGL